MEGPQRTLMEKIKALQEDANRLKTEFTFNDMETASWLNVHHDSNGNHNNNEEEDGVDNNRVYKLDQQNNSSDFDTNVDDWKDPLVGRYDHLNLHPSPECSDVRARESQPEDPSPDIKTSSITQDHSQAHQRQQQRMAELEAENQELQKKTKDMNQLIHLYDELKSMYAALKRSFESSETIRLEQKRLIDTLNHQSTYERRTVERRNHSPVLTNMEESMAESADILLGRMSTRFQEPPDEDTRLSEPRAKPRQVRVNTTPPVLSSSSSIRVVSKQRLKKSSLATVSTQSLNAKKSQQKLARLTRGTAASRSRISAIQRASLR